MNKGIETRLSNCLYCSSDNLISLFKKNTFEVSRCNNCGLKLVVNPPDQASIAKIYSKEYFLGDLSRYGYINYFEEEEYMQLNFRRIISGIEGFVERGKILDVGCASGSFLRLLSKKWERHGLDISDYISKCAQENSDLKIQAGELSESAYDMNSFDVVTFFDVLDHARDPFRDLKSASKILKNGGLLVITCGDSEAFFANLMRSKWYLYVPPTHLFFFSKKTLLRILKDLGFVPLKVEYSGKYVFLQLCFFRLSYIFPFKFLKKVYLFFKKHPILGKIKIYIDFHDVITVYAKKA